MEKIFIPLQVKLHAKKKWQAIPLDTWVSLSAPQKGQAPQSSLLLQEIWQSLLQKKKSKRSSPPFILHWSGPQEIGLSTWLNHALNFTELKKKELARFSFADGLVLPQLDSLQENLASLLVLEELQDAEVWEQQALAEHMLAWLQPSSSRIPKILILAGADSEHRLISACREIWPKEFWADLSFHALAEKEFIQALSLNSKSETLPFLLKPAEAQCLWKLSLGLPVVAYRWLQALNFLRTKGKVHQEEPWPKTEAVLAKLGWDCLNSEVQNILTYLALHLAWLSESQLEKLTALSRSKVAASLQALQHFGCVKTSSNFPDRWCLSWPQLQQEIEISLSLQTRESLHAQLFEVFLQEAHWPFRPTWLAFHGAGAKKIEETYFWQMAAGDGYRSYGDMSKASAYYQEASQQPLDLSKKINSYQELAATSLERGDYENALKYFQNRAAEQATEISTLSSYFGMFRAYLGLGAVRKAKNLWQVLRQVLVKIEMQEKDIPQGREGKALFQLLEGQLQLLTGERGAALESLRQAAHGFTAVGDLAGKIEVLLSLTAPLIELGLWQEAKKLLKPVLSWPELKEVPALEHSLHLRALAVDAFGDLSEETKLTIKFLEKFTHTEESSLFPLGRAEDWLKFWFHLSLAAQTHQDEAAFQVYLGRALQVVAALSEKFSPEAESSFKKRPDVGRILRLKGVL